MIAIMLPFAVRLGVDTMLITMAGIYAAGIYSGSTSGIFIIYREMLLNSSNDRGL